MHQNIEAKAVGSGRKRWRGANPSNSMDDKSHDINQGPFPNMAKNQKQDNLVVNYQKEKRMLGNRIVRRVFMLASDRF